MRGSYHVVVQNRRVRFEFDLRRNITIVRGDSATGKTTLMSLVEAYDSYGAESGVEVVCARRCVALSNANWEVVLSNTRSSIVFLDEDVRAAKTPEFARRVRESDNYYVIITRESLPDLPYSVDEIYGIRESGRYADLRRTYNSFFRLYEPAVPRILGTARMVVAEDSNAGFQFLQAVVGDGVSVKSARGKANVRRLLMEHVGERIVVIADGAAFGPEMADVHLFACMHSEVYVYLPESFEWVVLASGLVDGKRLEDMLWHTEDYVESAEFFSWEQFFTHVLVQETEGTYLRYAKSALNAAYLNEREREALLAVMEVVRPLICGDEAAVGEAERERA